MSGWRSKVHSLRVRRVLVPALILGALGIYGANSKLDQPAAISFEPQIATEAVADRDAEFNRFFGPRPPQRSAVAKMPPLRPAIKLPTIAMTPDTLIVPIAGDTKRRSVRPAAASPAGAFITALTETSGASTSADITIEEFERDPNLDR